ncbi:MAG: FlgD immunoglobulin-like domain containing protein [Calditrichia bacterium]
MDSLTLSLNEGWNMICGLSCDVPLSSVVDPDSIIVPLTLFGFNGSYIQTDTIRQGSGYWLKADTAGQVTLSCGAALQPIAKVSTAALDLDAFPALKISDASGAAQTLYFNVSIKDKNTKLSYSLPPLPPAGAFDARFEGDYRISQQGEDIIRLQSDHFPLNIIPSNLKRGEGFAYAVQEIIAGETGSTHILNNGNRIEITNPNVTSLRLTKTEAPVPLTFEVKQNYPNPFNPSTTIKYAIPQPGKVDIIIYNALGQKIKTLVSGNKEAGFHEVVWDATNEAGLKVGSGIFFYTVKAGDQQAVGKMILLR